MSTRIRWWRCLESLFRKPIDNRTNIRHRNAIDGAIQRRLSRFEKGEGYAGDGCVSAKAWLRWKCHLAHTAASERVEVARETQSLELTTEAMVEGRNKCRVGTSLLVFELAHPRTETEGYWLRCSSDISSMHTAADSMSTSSWPGAIAIP